MDKFPKRKLNRLKNYDYSNNGYYFITVCAYNRKKWFGEIQNNEMVLNLYGEIGLQHLQNLPNHYHNLEINTFVIMPNHVHAIIIIGNHDSTQLSDIDNGQALGLSLHNLSLHNQNISLSKIMRDFKSFTSREINKILFLDRMLCRDKAKPCPISTSFKWQRSFYDHVIRNDQSLNNTREYIANNPSRWDYDENNIKNCKVMV